MTPRMPHYDLYLRDDWYFSQAEEDNIRAHPNRDMTGVEEASAVCPTCLPTQFDVQDAIDANRGAAIAEGCEVSKATETSDTDEQRAETEMLRQGKCLAWLKYCYKHKQERKDNSRLAVQSCAEEEEEDDDDDDDIQTSMFVLDLDKVFWG